MLKRKITDYNQALQYCFLLLKYRKRTENELRRRLSQRQCPEAVQKKVVARLKEGGFVSSDMDFAAEWADYKLTSGYGVNRVMADLIKRGVGPEARERIKRRFENEKREDSRGMIRQLIERRYSGQQPMALQQQKLIRFLLQRGFLYQDIREVLDEIA